MRNFKTISPCPAFRPSRDKWGMGVRHALFPMPTLGAHPCGGCRLPDAILHGKRSFRPRGRAVQHLATAEFRVRLFSPLNRWLRHRLANQVKTRLQFSFAS